jgi:hypothetical protein
MDGVPLGERKNPESKTIKKGIFQGRVLSQNFLWAYQFRNAAKMKQGG